MGGNVKFEYGTPVPFALDVDISEYSCNIVREVCYRIMGHISNLNRNTECIIIGSTSLLFEDVFDFHLCDTLKEIGDIDLAFNKAGWDTLNDIISRDNFIGNMDIIDTKKHGSVISLLIEHDRVYRQVDCNLIPTGVDTNDYMFLHSSSWSDVKHGFSGIHHKLLLNAVGRDIMKFSISHGLKMRNDTSKNIGVTHPDDICMKLFGEVENPDLIGSFYGICALIKQYVSPEYYQPIYNKFMTSCSERPTKPHSAAISYLYQTIIA